jgi:hypothetical protein
MKIKEGLILTLQIVGYLIFIVITAPVQFILWVDRMVVTALEAREERKQGRRD